MTDTDRQSTRCVDQNERAQEGAKSLGTEVDISVFISYSRDPKTDKKVLALANSLLSNGIEVVLDRYVENSGPEDGWPSWMLRSIEDCNYILVVCTEGYLENLRNKPNTQCGAGAKWESVLIMQDLYSCQASSSRYVPILLREQHVSFIPKPLQHFNYYCLDDSNGFENLLRKLTDQPKVVKPERSSIPKLDTPVSNRPRLTSEPRIRAQIELDGLYSDFSEEDQKRIMHKISKLLECGVNELSIDAIREGSIIVEFSLPERYQNQLINVFENIKEISGFEILEAEVNYIDINILSEMRSSPAIRGDSIDNSEASSLITYSKHGGDYYIKFIGSPGLQFLVAFDNFINQMFYDHNLKSVTIDLDDGGWLSSTAIGLLVKLSNVLRTKLHHQPEIITTNKHILALIDNMKLAACYIIHEASNNAKYDFKAIETADLDCEHVRNVVLEAHSGLMSLNSKVSMSYIQDEVQKINGGLAD